MKNNIKQQGLELLAQIIGKRLLSFSGPYMSEALEGEQILISCENLDIVIEGQVEFLELGGNLDEFTRIDVYKSPRKLVAQAIEKGNVYYQNSGGLIVDVMICREYINKTENEKDMWEYETDNSVILVLDNGIISISKVSHHAELLKVSFLNSLNVEEIEDTSGRFSPDLFNKYLKVRRIFSVSQLLGASTD